MARPFPNTFDKDSMSPGGNTPISYKADVNRQKTKKWAEAKPVDYGGDDWGDEDEYDLPPPPVPKVTGLRQQGQALPNAQRTEPPMVDNGKKAYGELPPLPGASNPRGRSNSFDADEERNFSNNTARQPSPSTTTAPSSGPGPATRFSQIAGVQASRGPSGPPPLSISTQQSPPATGLRKASKVVSPVAEVETPPPDVQRPGRKNTGESAPSLPSSSVYSQTPTSDTRTPSSDYQARRDFSPSAVVPPLSTRASPAPQANDYSPAGKFPARKSSLSQLAGPDLATITQRPQESTTPKPWSAGRSASPGPAAQPPTSPAKVIPPFIRPADLYRREQERQSMESGRPSMDSIMGARNTDRSESPAKPQLRGRSSSDSLGGGGRRRTSFEGDDTSDSGRRLMPMLEPVRERKSEYGFEGFNVNDQGSHQDTQESHEPSDATKLDVEEARRHSVSPKLPDLNRISGFGMDMFSQSKPEASEAPVVKDNETTPRNSTAAPVASPPEEEPTLRNQPSFGFRSVVNQAFDRTDDSSVPATPASRSGSGVRRTDSESTGTTGISPIMSRVPSSAAPDNGNRDFSTPSIPEVINEQAAAEPSVHQPQLVTGFKPGHRRDISTPSPGNSPARTPDVAKPNAPTQGHEAVISEPSPTSEADNEPLQPPRPIHEREPSFRPALPGGWTSYTTTERSNTPSQDGQPILSEDTQTPLKDVPGGPNRAESDYDLTPTTTKHSLPASALGAAVVGAAVMGGEQLRKASPAGTPRSESSTVNLGNDALPTPDPAMAPSSNVYSTSTIAPRLSNLPPLEQAPKETQLRPDTVHRPISESPDGPPPPPKDTPQPEATDNSGYFPPTVPLKQKTPAEIAAEQHLEPPSRPQVVPTLSTDTGPDDEVNDKLRQEIVRSLSPRLSDSGRQDDQYDDGASYGAGRESTYLPREYDNYWASTNEDQEPVPAIAPPSTAGPSSSGGAPTVDSGHVEPEIPPLNPRKTDQPEPERPTIQQRFSWERSNESVPLGASEAANANTGATPDTASTGPVESVGLQQEPLMSEPVITTAPPATSVQSESQPSSAHPGTDAALLAGGAVAATGAAAAYANSSLEPKSRRLSLAEEKDPQVASYAVSPTPPEDEHPSRSPQPYAPLLTDQPSHPSAPSTVSPVTVHSPVNKQIPQTGKLMTFAQIMAIKPTQQRIQTYDEHREQFAAMESGLSNWISTLKSQHPEHADVTGSWGGSRYSVPSGSARSKFGKPTGPGALPAQQPYYQQYLNASSPNTPTTPVSRPGQGMPGNASQQGFSPGGAKITSQQVQAKGKEFLHTAGVFGGKAGKAGKGLLAKGKSRLRGAGGDKTSPPSKPKNERRTSWGLPLGMSRSSGRQDAPMRDSQQNVPTPIGAGSRSNTMPLHRASSPPQFATPARASMDGTMTGARYTVSPPTSRDGDPFTSREIRSEAQADAEEEGRDHLGIPAPIAKHQPSWDPFNATPIAEEEAFHYGQRPDHSIPSNSAHHQDFLLPPAPRSERDSNEISFYDASEEQPDEPDEPTEDWVMVSPEEPKDLPFQDERKDLPLQNESKDLPPQNEPEDFPARSEPTSALVPAAVQAPASEPLRESETMPTQTLGMPPASVLNRPRGSAVEELSPPLPASPPKVSPPISTTTEPVAVQPTPPPPRAEPQGQSSSSFLPPIRRTSTFGLGFGSRQKRPRFPIDDDEDEELSGGVSPQESSENNGAEVAALAGSTIVGGRGAAHAMGMPRPDSEAWPAEVRKEMIRQEEVPPVPSISQPSAPHQSQEGPHQQTPIVQPEPMRPDNVQRGSVDYGQRSIQHTPQENLAPPAAYTPTGSTNPRKSEEAWRPNANAAAPPSHGPQTQWVEPTGNPSRNSWEPQRNRGMSGSSQNLTRPNGNYVERPTLAGPVQLKSFDQPPSSAQRYPDLFRPEQPLPSAPGTYGDRALAESRESRDLPAHYYQQPIPREAAFLPRQQTNEYQLPGVGPPTEEPSPGKARRNSGFFRELGGRMSRGSSRERGGSISHDDGFSNPVRPFDSRGNEYAESSVTSEEGKEQKKKRSGFFGKGNLSRASTGGLGPPQSRESMVAHNPGSRVDLLASEQSSPIHDKKRSFFGTTLMEPKSKLHKPERASTSSAVEEPGKKKRFSGLTGFFGKPATGSSPSRASLPAQSREQPQAVRQTSYNERQPIESPSFNQQKGAPSAQNLQLQPDHSYPPSNYRPPTSPNYPPRANNYQPLTTDHYQPHSPNHPPPATGVRAPSQSRNLLSKLTTNNSSSSPDSRKEKSKSRRPSAAGLLNGFMGRKSQQSDRDRDESRSQGSQSQTSRQALPPARTYTDLQEEHQREQPIQPPKQQRVEQPILQPAPQKHIPWQDPSFRTQERGRRVSREPQYDSVPIPGGYSLVRGQGASTAPTEYDPRGLNRAQQADPRFGHSQTWGPSQNSSPQGQVQPQQYFNGPQYQSPPPQSYPSPLSQQYHSPVSQQSVSSPTNGQERHKPPSLGALETYESYNRSSSRRLSREDLLARSPARLPEGQQPPYQLSLPGDASDGEEDKPLPIEKDPIIITSTPSPNSNSKDPIKRLQQPVLQHPGSPAGYPVPDSTFSPVNPSANDLPPPPPPKWPNHLDAQYRPGHHHTLSADDSLNLSMMDLDRSNTRRTAVSAVSNMSSPAQPDVGLGRTDSLTVPHNLGAKDSPSPSPPTPEERENVERGRRDERGTSREKRISTGGASTGGDPVKTTVLEHRPVVEDDLYDASPRLPKTVNPPTSSFNFNGNAHPASPTNGNGAGPSKLNPAQGKENENEHAAELDNTDQERYRAAREEKIFYDGGVADEGEVQPSMSATSYPGQEWNPYAGVGFEDGYE